LLNLVASSFANPHLWERIKEFLFQRRKSHGLPGLRRFCCRTLDLLNLLSQARGELFIQLDTGSCGGFKTLTDSCDQQEALVEVIRQGLIPFAAGANAPAGSGNREPKREPGVHSVFRISIDISGNHFGIDLSNVGSLSLEKRKGENVDFADQGEDFLLANIVDALKTLLQEGIEPLSKTQGSQGA